MPRRHLRFSPLLHQHPPKHQQGATYLLLLFVVALSGVLLAGLGQVWSTASRRDKEADLIFIGNQYRLAISSYYRASPDENKQYPKSFDDLLLDKRFPYIKRHLRQRYADPMTGKAEWGVIREQDRIMGVYSLDTRKPIKQSGFSRDASSLENAASYSEWRFVASN